MASASVRAPLFPPPSSRPFTGGRWDIEFRLALAPGGTRRGSVAYGNGVSLEVRASYHLIMSWASLLYLGKCDESLTSFLYRPKPLEAEHQVESS